MHLNFVVTSADVGTNGAIILGDRKHWLALECALMSRFRLQPSAMIPTPSLDHFTKEDWQHVYEPGQDSFLFLDALAAEAPFFKNKLQPKIIVEIGPGSGIVTTFVASLLGPDRAYFCADINPKACQATLRTLSANVSQSHSVEPVRSDLLSAFGRLKGQIDLLLFNPPYVPTEQEETGRQDLYAAWAGGPEGVDTLVRLMQNIEDWIAPGGCFFLIAVKENNPQQIAKDMMAKGFDVDVRILSSMHP